MSEKGFLVFVCSLLLVFQPAFAAPPMAIGTLNGNGHAKVNGTIVPNGVVLYAGDQVSTTSGSTALIYLAKGGKVALGGSTVAKLTANDKGFTVALNHGKVLAVTGKATPLIVNADGVKVEPKRKTGSYEVALNGNKLEVLSRTGTTLAEAPNRTAEVGEGKLMKATLTAGGPAPAGKSKRKMVLVVLIAAGIAGAGFGIAAAEPSRKCVSQSTLGCP